MTYKEYEKLSRRIVSKYASNFVNDDELFSLVFESIVNADNRWIDGGGLPRDGYIEMHGIYAVRTFFGRRKSKKRHSALHNNIKENKRVEPEYNMILKDIVYCINTNPSMSKKQKEIAFAYMDGNKITQSFRRLRHKLKQDQRLQDIWYNI